MDLLLVASLLLVAMHLVTSCDPKKCFQRFDGTGSLKKMFGNDEGPYKPPTLGCECNLFDAIVYL